MLIVFGPGEGVEEIGAPTFSWVCTFVQTSEENIVAPIRF